MLNGSPCERKPELIATTHEFESREIESLNVVNFFNLFS